MSSAYQSGHYAAQDSPRLYGSEDSYIESPQLGSTRRDTQARSSGGTFDTTMSSDSTGRESAATTITTPNQGPPYYSKKIVVVGDGGCGKTCMLISYSQGYFPDKYVPTVFENYITTKVHPPTGRSIELALWDTAGQEEYDRLRPLSYPETDLLLVCFAIDCPNSLENVMDKWYPEVQHFCPYTPLVLVGLKSDLRNKKTCVDLLKTQGLTPVTTEQGRAVAKKMNAAYMECSSKEMIGVHELFEGSIITIIEHDAGYAEEMKQQSGGGRQSKSKSPEGGPIIKKKKKRNCAFL